MNLSTTIPNLVGMTSPAPSATGQGPSPRSKIVALLALVGAVVYLVSPLDLIPDLIPVLCHVDDAGIMGVAIKNAKEAFWG